MKKIYLFLSLCFLAFNVHAQDPDPELSLPLIGSCLNPDDGTVSFIFDLSSNCPEADQNGELPGVAQLGFHSGANSWASIVEWDNANAVALDNNGMDSFLITVNVMDYYGVAFADLTDLQMVVNNGIANPADPWNLTLRDSTDGDNFGTPTDCSDLKMYVSTTPTCADLNQESSLVLFSDAGDSETCVDLANGLIQIDLDYGIACPEGDSMMILAGASALGFHSGANDWASVVEWDNANAVQLVNNGADNFSAIIDVQNYYGVALGDLNNIMIVANNGVANPAGAWDVGLRDPMDGGSFGNATPCSDLRLVVVEAPACDLEVGTENVILKRTLKVTPNPFHNRAFIEFDNPNHEIFDLRITDITGKTMRVMTGISGNRVLVERENLSAGVYFATMRDSKGHFATTKLLVK
jgi:hypothetical protein